MRNLFGREPHDVRESRKLTKQAIDLDLGTFDTIRCTAPNGKRMDLKATAFLEALLALHERRVQIAQDIVAEDAREGLS